MQNKTVHKKEEFIFGIRTVIEAVRAGKDFDKILIKRGLKGELIKELMDLLHDNRIPYQQVPEEKLNRVSRKNHQGVIALTSPVTFHNLENTIAEIYEKGEIPFLLMFDGISDVRNFGAMVRTAECAGIHAIVIPEKGAARIGSDAVKTSAGALHKMPICRVPQIKEAVKYMQNSGIRVLGASEKANDNYYSEKFTAPVCLVMGSEDVGLSDAVLRTCDGLIKIPLVGEIQSLNVSVAAGILIFDIVRQRLEQ